MNVLQTTPFHSKAIIDTKEKRKYMYEHGALYFIYLSMFLFFLYTLKYNNICMDKALSITLW